MPLAMSGHPLLPSAYTNGVGTPKDSIFEAQYPARTFPCQRFEGDLAVAAA